MNDQEYFTHYQQAFAMLFSDSSDDYVFLKDDNLRFQAITNKMLHLIGATSLTEVVNQTTEEVALKLKLANLELAQQFSQQDRDIKNTKCAATFLEVLTIKGKAKIFILNKVPIINPDTLNFVGIRVQLSNLIWPHAVKTLLKMHGAKGLLLGQKNTQDAWKEFPLTNMQHMVLFLCLNNYSYSEIAILLNEFGYEVTPIRVNDYLEQLKFIFHVRNKTQLIEKAIGLNFHIYLPEGLFNKRTSLEVSNQAATIICCNCLLNNCVNHQPANSATKLRA